MVILTYFTSKIIFVNGILQLLLGRFSYPTLQPALHSKRNNGKLSDCHKASAKHRFILQNKILVEQLRTSARGAHVCWPLSKGYD